MRARPKVGVFRLLSPSSPSAGPLLKTLNDRPEPVLPPKLDVAPEAPLPWEPRPKAEVGAVLPLVPEPLVPLPELPLPELPDPVPLLPLVPCAFAAQRQASSAKTMAMQYR